MSILVATTLAVTTNIVHTNVILTSSFHTNDVISTLAVALEFRDCPAQINATFLQLKKLQKVELIKDCNTSLILAIEDILKSFSNG